MTFVTVPCYKDSILLLVDINFFHWPSAQKCRHGKPQQIKDSALCTGSGGRPLSRCYNTHQLPSILSPLLPILVSYPIASAASQSFLEWNIFISELWRSVPNSKLCSQYATFLDSRARGMLWVAEQRKSAGALLKWHFTSNEFCYLHFSSLLSISLVVYLTSVHLLHSYVPFSPLELYSSYICSFFLVVLFSWGNIRVRL